MGITPMPDPPRHCHGGLHVPHLWFARCFCPHQASLVTLLILAPRPTPAAAQLSARWVRHMSCRTEVTGALLTRQAVELLLRHYPLAQVGWLVSALLGGWHLMALHH